MIYGVLHPMRSDRAAFANVESPALTFDLPGWLGYDLRNFRRGQIAIRICPQCDTAHKSRNEAQRLNCSVVSEPCERHSAEMTARRMGETL